MKAGRTLFLSFLMSAAVGFTVYLAVEREHNKIAVVDAIRLFDQFHMKKELEANAKVKLQATGRQADSIGNQLKMARATQNEDGVKKLSYAYNYVSASLEEEYKRSNRDINEQVWKRLNPIVEEFGKKKGLHLVIGANGMGSVLYNDDYYDMTEELIKYVNKKYEEGN